MPKRKNLGAINLRPPNDSKPERRDQFFQLREFAIAEFARNRKLKEGPTSFSQLWVEVLKNRYEPEVREKIADDKRIEQEARLSSAGEDLF